MSRSLIGAMFLMLATSGSVSRIRTSPGSAAHRSMLAGVPAVDDRAGKRAQASDQSQRSSFTTAPHAERH